MPERGWGEASSSRASSFVKSCRASSSLRLDDVADYSAKSTRRRASRPASPLGESMRGRRPYWRSPRSLDRHASLAMTTAPTDRRRHQTFPSLSKDFQIFPRKIQTFPSFFQGNSKNIPWPFPTKSMTWRRVPPPLALSKPLGAHSPSARTARHVAHSKKPSPRVNFKLTRILFFRKTRSRRSRTISPDSRAEPASRMGRGPAAQRNPNRQADIRCYLALRRRMTKAVFPPCVGNACSARGAGFR